jgi:hypothetical protein
MRESVSEEEMVGVASVDGNTLCLDEHELRDGDKENVGSGSGDTSPTILLCNICITGVLRTYILCKNTFILDFKSSSWSKDSRNYVQR